MNTPTCILCYSGGLDSTVLLYKLLTEHERPKCLLFNYGQRHAERELTAAREMCNGAGVAHDTVDLMAIRPLISRGCQLDHSIAVPEGHYALETMKQTITPNRNMVFISIAVAHAVATDCHVVAVACHSGDHAIYPDCRPEFIQGMDHVSLCAGWSPVHVVAPFVEIDKAGIVKIGASLNVPFDRTWSCYNGRDKHCGRCGTCYERREAFTLAGVTDPTEYEE